MAISTKRRQASSSASDDFSPSPSPPLPSSRPTKKANRTNTASSSSSKFSHVFNELSSRQNAGPAALPARTHTPSYHRPLLLDQPATIQSLLDWFASVSTNRSMPWRAPYIDPTSHPSSASLREARKIRAYQVWISEIMLQQTRVETVKSYWLQWMSKWPTIEALASAAEDDVLAAWRGLGYYSRATRIHTAAKKVASDPEMDGLLPETPAELEKNVPGVGPYTAGAISSIVFGKAVPILDGNVARVLSRQLGLYASPKAKVTTDLMWAAADLLVKKAYDVGGEKGTVPGEWNQALMELGSTVCTPLKPGCGDCPIRSSCRAYQEGENDSLKGKKRKKEVAIVDLEDLCSFCEPFPFEEEAAQDNTASKNVEEERQKGVKKLRQATLSFGFQPLKSQSKPPNQDTINIDKHIRKFPMKLEKKKIRQEECLVCIVTNSSGEYLLEQRPPIGLLASMWQFPSLTLCTTAAGPAAAGEENVHHLFPSTPVPQLIDSFVAALLDTTAINAVEERVKVASITHIFSHLHLTMHVYKVILGEPCGNTKLDGVKRDGNKAKTDGEGEKNKNFGSKLSDVAPRRWADADEVEAETMGTGMRNCWLALQTQEQQQQQSIEKAKTAARNKKK
ncbi:related to A/G-specific adenine DNA glycosylase [Ustilago trichophora]|uniref:Adenine DNA glycosylase n=1 Tax=Ustilago trichophora TaxID=86804 RepID=A0A5C3ED64_9BASI|nr:related to A/G-specific adenine DNA glycosylase [Ustilago trichophora]